MATIKEIAEKAGVSIGTVDRIIHNRGRYSADTARTVRRILKQTAYTPNIMARQLSQSKNCRIGVLLPYSEQDSGYWLIPLSGIHRAERDLKPFGLTLDILQYNRYNPESFRNAASKLLKMDFDGILMAPLLEEDSLNLLSRINHEIPIIFFDTDLPQAKRLSCIGQDSYQSGRLGARLINMLDRDIQENYRSKGRSSCNLVITPDIENEHLKNRIRGFTDYSAKTVESLRVSVESDHNLTSFHNQLGSRLTEGNLLNTADKITGIFIVDASAHFAASFISEFFTGSAAPGGPEAESPNIVGCDLVPENRKWLENGVIDFLLTQRPAEQGYTGINRLFRKIFLDEDCPEHEYTPIDIVTKENLIFLTNQTEPISDTSRRTNE